MALLCLCPVLLFPFASWCEWDVCVHALEISQGMLLVHPCLAYYLPPRAVVCLYCQAHRMEGPGVLPKASTRPARRARPLPHHLYLLFSNTATRLHTESCFSQACSILQGGLQLPQKRGGRHPAGGALSTPWPGSEAELPQPGICPSLLTALGQFLSSE